jgi:Flp pilus assembly protein TadG
MAALLHRLRTSTTGVAGVEMALVAPVLLICVLAVADFGMAVHERMQLASAVRVGAQVAMTDPTDVGRITQAVQQATDGLEPSRLTVTVATSGSGERTYVTVHVQENFPLLLSFPGVGTSIKLSADATMRTQGDVP